MEELKKYNFDRARACFAKYYEAAMNWIGDNTGDVEDNKEARLAYVRHSVVENIVDNLVYIVIFLVINWAM